MASVPNRTEMVLHHSYLILIQIQSKIRFVTIRTPVTKVMTILKTSKTGTPLEGIRFNPLDQVGFVYTKIKRQDATQRLKG